MNDDGRTGRSHALFGETAAVTYCGSRIRGWTAQSRKLIVFRRDALTFDNPDLIMHMAKHEFGHVLGLGDLYQHEEMNLNGVEAFLSGTVRI